MTINPLLPIHPSLSTGFTFKDSSIPGTLVFDDDYMGFTHTGFTTKYTSTGVQFPTHVVTTTSKIQGTSKAGTTQKETFRVKNPDEIAAFLLQKVECHHFMNPYISLPEDMRQRGFNITLRDNLPIGLEPSDVGNYVEIQGHPRNLRSFTEIVTRYLYPLAKELKERHEGSLAFSITPEEEIIVDDLYDKYVSDLNLLAAAIEQAIETYVELLHYKLSLYGINKIRFVKESKDFDPTPCESDEIYYDKLLDINAKSQTPTIRISERDARLIKIQQEQVLPQALEQVSEVLKQHFFVAGAKYKPEDAFNDPKRKHAAGHLAHYYDALWDPEILQPRSWILASVLNIYPSNELMETGLNFIKIVDFYKKDLTLNNKPFNDTFIDQVSFEHRYLRPVYGYLHRLALRIQIGKECDIDIIPKEQNERFKRSHHVRKVVIT